MARKKKVDLNYNVAELQPDELNALKALVKEFMERMTNLDNEIALLNEDKKELVEEYKEKLDYKTLAAAMKVVKIQQAVQHKDTFDLFIAALEDPTP